MLTTSSAAECIGHRMHLIHQHSACFAPTTLVFFQSPGTDERSKQVEAAKPDHTRLAALLTLVLGRGGRRGPERVAREVVP